VGYNKMKSLGVFTVNEDGTINIPAELLAQLGYNPGETPLMELVEDGIKFHKKKPKSVKKINQKPRPIL